MNTSSSPGQGCLRPVDSSDAEWREASPLTGVLRAIRLSTLVSTCIIFLDDRSTDIVGKLSEIYRVLKVIFC